MATERKRRALGELAEAFAPDTVDLWPEIRSRSRHREVRRRGVERRARLAAGLAIALLLALAAAMSTLWSPPQPVSAESILAKAGEAATQGARSYHLTMVSHSGLKAVGASTREAWFDGTRARQTFQLLDENGAPKGTIDIIFDGTQSWSVVSADGRVNVVHATGDDLKSRAEGIGQQDSLASFLALYNNDKSCMSASIQGEGTVAGRPTYQISVTPRPGSCKADLANEPATSGKQPDTSDKQPADPEAVQAKAQKALKQMVVWVDKETYLPLQTQTFDQAGEVLDESVATSVQYDVAFADSLFTYTPPAGATVMEAADKAAGQTVR